MKVLKQHMQTRIRAATTMVMTMPKTAPLVFPLLFSDTVILTSCTSLPSPKSQLIHDRLILSLLLFRAFITSGVVTTVDFSLINPVQFSSSALFVQSTVPSHCQSSGTHCPSPQLNAFPGHCASQLTKSLDRSMPYGQEHVYPDISRFIQMCEQ